MSSAAPCGRRPTSTGDATEAHTQPERLRLGHMLWEFAKEREGVSFPQTLGRTWEGPSATLQSLEGRYLHVELCLGCRPHSSVILHTKHLIHLASS